MIRMDHHVPSGWSFCKNHRQGLRGSGLGCPSAQRSDIQDTRSRSKRFSFARTVDGQLAEVLPIFRPSRRNLHSSAMYQFLPSASRWLAPSRSRTTTSFPVAGISGRVSRSAAARQRRAGARFRCFLRVRFVGCCGVFSDHGEEHWEYPTDDGLGLAQDKKSWRHLLRLRCVCTPQEEVFGSEELQDLVLRISTVFLKICG